MKAKKREPLDELSAFIERLRALGVTEYAGPSPAGAGRIEVKLGAQLVVAGDRPTAPKIDDKPIPQHVPKELEGIGVTPDVMADVLERARQMNPGS